MGGSQFLELFITKRETTIPFVTDLINICKKHNFYYQTNKSHIFDSFKWNHPMDNLTLEEAIKFFGNKGAGWIDLYDNKIEIGLMIETLGEIAYVKSDEERKERIQKNKLGYIGIMVDDVFFKGPNYYDELRETPEDIYLENLKKIIELAKDLYYYLSPVYGYMVGTFPNTFEEYQPHENEIVDLNIKHLFKVNFFSPQLVKKIGEENITYISKYNFNVEKLDDSGYLLFYIGCDVYDFDKNDFKNAEGVLGFQ